MLIDATGFFIRFVENFRRQLISFLSSREEKELPYSKKSPCEDSWGWQDSRPTELTEYQLQFVLPKGETITEKLFCRQFYRRKYFTQGTTSDITRLIRAKVHRPLILISTPTISYIGCFKESSILNFNSIDSLTSLISISLNNNVHVYN